VLNTITTGAMIRLGKTYGNLMVDLRAMSAKLVDRGERILMEVCGMTRHDARTLIDAAGGRVSIDRPPPDRRDESPDRIIVGLMSGTSADGISAAAARFTPGVGAA